MLIHLGIFDDGDVAPTEMLMEVDDLTVNDLLELRVEAERLYGRQVPDHALFWTARPDPCTKGIPETHAHVQPGGACDNCGEQVYDDGPAT